MLVPDLYQLLHISPAATSSDIKKAYRHMAFLYHPDRNQHDPEAATHFAAIREAYSILYNPVKRRQYDLGRYVNRGNYSFTGAIASEPAEILALCNSLVSRIEQQPVHRVNRDGLQLEIMHILSAHHLDLLKQRGDVPINRLVVSELLRAMHPLAWPSAQPIFFQLASIAESDPASLQEIIQFSAGMRRRYYWDRYKVLLAFLAAMLLCLLIYWAVLP
jgi:hypothetical protein